MKHIETLESDFNDDYAAGFSDGYDMGKEYTEEYYGELMDREWLSSPEFANARSAFRTRMNG